MADERSNSVLNSSGIRLGCGRQAIQRRDSSRRPGARCPDGRIVEAHVCQVKSSTILYDYETVGKVAIPTMLHVYFHRQKMRVDRCQCGRGEFAFCHAQGRHGRTTDERSQSTYTKTAGLFTFPSTTATRQHGLVTHRVTILSPALSIREMKKNYVSARRADC